MPGMLVTAPPWPAAAANVRRYPVTSRRVELPFHGKRGRGLLVSQAHGAIRAAGPARPCLPAQGETFAEVAVGFGVGTSTAWRYVNETVALFAARAPKLRKMVRDARKAGPCKAPLTKRARERPAQDLAHPPQAPLLPLACRTTRQGHSRFAGPRGRSCMKKVSVFDNSRSCGCCAVGVRASHPPVPVPALPGLRGGPGTRCPLWRDIWPCEGGAGRVTLRLLLLTTGPRSPLL